MPYTAFIHNVTILDDMLLLVRSRDIIFDKYVYRPEQSRLMLEFSRFDQFNRILQLNEVNITPAYDKSSIIVRGGWRSINHCRSCLDNFQHLSAKFGANALIYIVRGNIKKAVAALIAAGFNASVNS